MIAYLFSSVSCCQGSNCLNLKVIDGGPSCAVEDSAKKQVVDASYSTCKHFTGSTSCGAYKYTYFFLAFTDTRIRTCFNSGWSDKITVTCKKTSYTVLDTADANKYNYDFVVALDKPKIPLGPCSYNSTYSNANNVPLCGFDINLF